MILQARHRTAGLIIVAIAVVGIGVLTLRPGSGTGSVHPLWCLSCISFGSRAGTDLLLNTLLFIPLAFGLWHAGLGVRGTMVTVIATTVTIELLQMMVIPGRYASIGDVLANTCGGALGVGLGPRWPVFVVPDRDAGRRLAVAAAVLWIALLGISAWGLGPALPAAPWSVSWNPAETPDRRLTGQVLSSSVNGVALRPGRYPEDHQLVRDLRDRTARFDAVLLANGRSNERDSRVDIEDATGTRIASLGQDDRDLLFRVRLRARDLRLRAPSARVADALPSKLDVRRTATAFTGDTIRITGELASAHMRVRATIGDARVEHALALGPELGWTFFLPVPAPVPAWILSVIGGVWLGLLLVPLAYWAGRHAALRATPSDTGVRRRNGLALAGMIAAALIVVPLVTRSAPVSLVGWLVVALSTASGWALGVGSARLRVVSLVRESFPGAAPSPLH